MSPPVQRIGRTSRDWPLALGIGLVGLALIVAVAKPWALGSTGAGPGPSPTAIATGAEARASTPRLPATPEPTPDPAAEFCLAPSGWRIMSVERFDGQTIRVWETIDPIEATGPTDPRLPQGLVVSTAVLEVGWCAPDPSLDRPTGAVTTLVWALDDHGVATRIDVRPGTAPSGRGATYLPPLRAGRVQPDWPPGRYVFEIVGAADSTGYWFAAEVRRYVPASPAPRVSPSPSAARP